MNPERFLWPGGCPEARVVQAEPSPPGGSDPLRAAVWGPVYLRLLHLRRAMTSPVVPLCPTGVCSAQGNF